MNYIITGATSSTGQVLAQLVTNDKNSKLVLISRSLNETLKSLENSNVKYFSGVDLFKFHDYNEIIRFIDSTFNEPFSLIHTAGDFWEHLPFLEVELDTAINMMNSHYGTLYAVCHALLPIMIKKGGGKIITYSCNATNYNFPNMLPFTAAKAAVEATIKCIAHEYSQHNIVANAIAISSLKTEANKRSKPYGDYEHYLSLEELGYTTLDLLNQRGKLMNGSVINCFEHSDSYYNQGYFQRIKQK